MTDSVTGCPQWNGHRGDSPAGGVIWGCARGTACPRWTAVTPRAGLDPMDEIETSWTTIACNGVPLDPAAYAGQPAGPDLTV